MTDTDTDTDRVLRSADPAAHRTAPAPGPLPDLATVVPLRASRSRWLPAGAAAAVVAVVGAGVAVLPSWDGGGGRAGARPSPAVAPPATAESKPPQRAHTASAGADFQRARTLLGALQGAVPAKYALPTGPPNGGRYGTPQYGPTIGPDGQRMPASNFQAVRDEGYEGYTGYKYDADSTVTAGGRTGSVSAQLWVGVPAAGACAVARTVLGRPDLTCSETPTPAGPVAFVVRAGKDDPRVSQWAVSRHADGTVVVVSQGVGVLNGAIPRLTAPVFTKAQLVALAAGARFAR